MPLLPRRTRVLGFAFLALAPVSNLSAQVLWIGVGSSQDYFSATNWRGGAVPVNNGTASISFGNGDDTILLTAPVDVSTIAFQDVGEHLDFDFKADSATTLTLRNGLSTPSANTGVKVALEPNVSLVLPTNQTWSVASSTNGAAPTFLIKSVISGAGKLTLSGNSSNPATIILKGNNTLSGGMVLNGATAMPYTNSAFGTGALTITNGGITAFNTLTIANAISLGGTFNAKSSDATLTLSGPVTLTSNATINTQASPNTSYPVVLSGGITGGFSLTKSGLGNVFLTGTNTYTGGTAANNGALIFGNAGAIAGTVTINNGAYAGLAFTGGDLTTDFANFSKSTSGAIGFDTLPGNATRVISTNIDLSSTTGIGFTNSAVKLGTATSATLTGTITPGGTGTGPYQFAGGLGGVLTVQSALTGSRSLSLFNSGAGTMRLVLQGNNTYSLGTNVSGGYLVFDGANSLPASGSLTASQTSAYIGLTENTGVSAATFVSRFNAAGTNGIVGFDSAVTSAPRTVDLTGVDFSGFGSNFALGTSTAVTLTGTLTKSSGATGIHLTSTDGGALTVNSAITSGVLTLGGNSNLKQGTITLNGANTYSGGTAFSGSLKVIAGSASAFGTGALTLGSNNPTVLQTSGNYTLANNIVLNSSAQFTTLQVGGSNNFSLSGVISGGSATNRSGLLKVDTNTLTLEGTNTFSGPLEIAGGLLQIINDAGTGLAPLHLTGGNATFTTANPTVYGLEGAAGTTLTLAANSTLTLNTADESYEYLGNIVSSGAGAALVITGGGDQQFEGNNTGISGTTVLNGAIVAHSNQSFGSGAITLNATGESAVAGLGVVRGVTLTNAINFTSGVIIGFGTLTPSNGPVQVGTNRTLSPGAGRADFAPGKLSFGNGLGFSSGGTYEWMVTDANVSTGLYGTIDVTGALTISSTAGSPFKLELSTNDGNGNDAWASNFNSGLAYTWTILSATGGITGFSADRFSISSTGFQNHLGGGSFSLTADSNHLFLNFAPIPEPEVTSLMLVGIGALGLRCWRKRRPSHRVRTAA